MPISVLLTRPVMASERFGQQLKDRFGDQIEVIKSPLIGITPCAEQIDLTGYKGVVFTSSNGVRVASGLGVDTVLPAYCLGTATTATAISAGWGAKQCGLDAQSLISEVTALFPTGPLLHLAGVHTRGNVATCLTENGVRTQALTIYNQTVLPLSEEALAKLIGGTSMIVPLFSPRSAAQFCQTAPFSENVVSIAMSEAVAQSMTGRWQSGLSIVTTPTAEAMFDAVEMQINRLSRVERTDTGQ